VRSQSVIEVEPVDEETDFGHKKKTQFHTETGASASETDNDWDDDNNLIGMHSQSQQVLF
jgi:hypothetical protein